MQAIVIAVVGPTGVGKTALCLKIAQDFQTAIISCDARQMYRRMDIGTAKPSLEELALVEHHFIDNLDIEAEYNAGRYEQEALAKIEALHPSKKILILTGGSGLYFQSVCDGIDDLPKIDPDIRIKLNEDFGNHGLKFLHDQFEKLDPEYFKNLSYSEQNNGQRLIRALEILIGTGKSIKSFQKKTKKQRPFRCIKIGLKRDREILYKRINSRVDQMIEDGLLEEVKSLLPFSHCNSMQSVGYRELVQYFNGEIDKTEAIRLIKRNSRRYAKRQMTWFSKDDEINWFDADDLNGVMEFVKGIV